ncbi:MAG: hypothetical protein IJ192_04210 [Clostridia bacterium]|nr:hypothetical protein [Clostridia bacterium]
MLGVILVIVYMAAGYWAVGKTIYANKIRIGTLGDLFIRRVITGTLFGLVLIPVAIIKSIAGR